MKKIITNYLIKLIISYIIIIKFLIIIIISYLLTSFILLNFDFTQWTICQRSLLIFINLLFTLIYSIYHISEN